jgi:hypothetical protein
MHASEVGNCFSTCVSSRKDGNGSGRMYGSFVNRFCKGENVERFGVDKAF